MAASRLRWGRPSSTDDTARRGLTNGTDGERKLPSRSLQCWPIGTLLRADGGDCESVVAQFARAGVDVYALAEWLQREGARSFGKSWEELMAQIASKSAELEHAAM